MSFIFNCKLTFPFHSFSSIVYAALNSFLFLMISIWSPNPKPIPAIFPFPISLGFELHERKGLLSSICSSFNRLPVGGVMLVFDIAYARVNEPLWDFYRIMDTAGKGHETTWLLSAFPPPKKGPWKCAAIRRTS